MSTLNTSAIKAAKLGSTDLQAVYKGSVKVWEKTTPAPTEVKEF